MAPWSGSARVALRTCSVLPHEPAAVHYQPKVSSGQGPPHRLGWPARYEHRSLLLTANQPFGQWDKIFPQPAMTVAAIDRLVQRATIFELNVESYRRRTASDNKRSRQRAAATAGETADQTTGAPPRPLRNGAQ